MRDGETFYDAVYRYPVGGMDIAPNYAYSVFLEDGYWHAKNDKYYESGTLELYFDYSAMEVKVYINGKYETSFSIPSIDSTIKTG
jgi:hypothetical protein